MRFRSILASLTLAIIAALPIQAQKTTVTGVVQDPNGTAYASGTFNIDFVNGSGCGLPLLQGSPFQTQFTGGLDSSGNLPSMSMADNNQVCTGSQWRFSICNSLGRTCFSTLITITGASQSVSATLKVAATVLPGVGSATSLISNSANPSTVGQARFATTDSIGFRNAANTANCLITDTGAAAAANGQLADALSIGTATTCGLQLFGLVSFGANPSNSGFIRMGAGDAINLRNNGNSADINGLSETIGAVVQVGDANGIAIGVLGNAFLAAPASATLQQGGINVAAPTNQTSQAVGSRGGTDTNVAGANWNQQPGAGTGNSLPSQYNINGPANGGVSGTTAQTQVLRMGTNWSKVLTNNTVTTVVNATDASNTSAALIIHYAIEIFDGTNVQYEVGLVMCAINNKAGALTQNTCTKSGNIQGVTSGTLTVTWTITAANPGAVQINSNSSLATTTNRLTYNIENLTQQAVVIQ